MTTIYCIQYPQVTVRYAFNGQSFTNKTIKIITLNVSDLTGHCHVLIVFILCQIKLAQFFFSSNPMTKLTDCIVCIKSCLGSYFYF